MRETNPNNNRRNHASAESAPHAIKQIRTTITISQAVEDGKANPKYQRASLHTSGRLKLEAKAHRPPSHRAQQDNLILHSKEKHALRSNCPEDLTPSSFASDASVCGIFSGGIILPSETSTVQIG